MLIMYFCASSMKSVTELKDLGCCLEKALALRQPGWSQLLCLPLCWVHACFLCIPMLHAAIFLVRKLKLPAFAKLAQS